MNSRDDRKPPLTPEEARYLDGTLSDAERRAFEATLEKDPARAAALREDLGALALWKDDARAQATALDLDALADQVLASVRAGRPTPAQVGFPKAYAIAAMLLITIGAVGTLVVRGTQSPREGVMPSRIEASLIEAMADDPALWLGDEGGR
jgi:anti-sigma factor RsiW